MRRLFLCAAVLTLVACAHQAPESTVSLPTVPAGQAVVLLMRTTVDNLKVELRDAQGRHLATLAPQTQATLVLPPGAHQLLTYSVPIVGQPAEVAPPVPLSLAAGDRVLLQLDGRLHFTGAAPSGLAMGVEIGRSGPTPYAPPNQMVMPGSRSWTVLTEGEARAALPDLKAVAAQ